MRRWLSCEGRREGGGDGGRRVSCSCMELLRVGGPLLDEDEGLAIVCVGMMPAVDWRRWIVGGCCCSGATMPLMMVGCIIGGLVSLGRRVCCPSTKG